MHTFTHSQDTFPTWHSKSHFPAPFLQTLPVPIMLLKGAPCISLHLSTHTVSTLQRAGLLTWLWIQTNMTVNTTQQWSTHLNTRCIHPTQTFHKCYGGCWQHQTYWVISVDRWDNKCPFNGEAIYGRVWRKGSGKQGLECETVPVRRGKQASSCCLKPALQPGIIFFCNLKQYNPWSCHLQCLPNSTMWLWCVYVGWVRRSLHCAASQFATSQPTVLTPQHCSWQHCSLPLNSREMTFKQLRMNSPMKFNLYFTDLFPVTNDKYVLPYSHPCCGH